MRKKWTVVFPAFKDRPELRQERSIPWIVWLIDKWFFWSHEFLYYVNKRLHKKLMHPFCYAYDMYITPWVYKHERIDFSDF